MQLAAQTYSSFQTIAPSNTTTVNCRAIFVGTAGNLLLAPNIGAVGSPVTFAVIAGQILPVELDQGIVLASSTAAGLVALA